jgi:hypothetical protein
MANPTLSSLLGSFFRSFYNEDKPLKIAGLFLTFPRIVRVKDAG